MTISQILTASLLATLCMTQAAEAKKFRFGGFGRAAGNTVKHYGIHNGIHTLTVDELVSCLKGEAELEALEARINEREASINRQQAELEAFGSSLSIAEAMVDRYSQQSIDAYNAKVATYEEKRIAFNSGIESFNAEIASYNGRTDALNIQCGNKSYYEDDMAAAQARILTQ